MAATVRYLSEQGMLVRLVSNTYEVFDGELQPVSAKGYLPIRIIQVFLRWKKNITGLAGSRYLQEWLFDYFASRNLGKPDIIYLDSERYPEVGRVARKKGIMTVGYQRMANISYITSVLEEEREKFQLNSKFLNSRLNGRRLAGLHAMNNILAHSQLVKDTDIGYGMDESKIQVVYGCTDSDTYKPDISKRGFKTVVLFAGHDPLLKGLLYLLQAWKDIPHKELNAELWIAGDCPASIQEKFSQLTDVRYLGTQSDMVDIYQQASILVHPALIDAGPKVVTEAMSSGLPAIVTNAVGYSEIIDDGYNGYTVPARNAQALIKPVTILLGNPDLLDEMSKNARESVKNLTMAFHAEAVSSAITGIYSENTPK
jgi:glycosyltransferase involved in cell wall biosynthesis